MRLPHHARRGLAIVLAIALAACTSTPEPEPEPDPAGGQGGAMPATAEAEADGPPMSAYSRPGFPAYEADGRLWVFRSGSEDLDTFRTVGEPARRVTRIGRGPDGMTIMAPDGETIDAYTSARKYGRPGFATFDDDGRLWVFRAGSDELEGFLDVGEPAKRVTRIGRGPDGMTIMGPDGETIDSYLTAWKHGKPGFAVFGEDGRMWVFREGSPDLVSYLEVGEPARRVTRIGRGPDGMTIMAPDTQTMDAYQNAPGGMMPGLDRPGYHVVETEGRMWVFRRGSESLSEFRRSGEPAKRVTRIGRGPDGMTIMAPDTETIDAYLAAL